MLDDEYAVSYQEVRSGASLAFIPGMVMVPEEYQRLDKSALSKEAQLIVDTAHGIYEEWILDEILINDEQPRLILIFQANIPQKAMTLRINLGKLSLEIEHGLSIEVLRVHLDILRR